MEIKFKDDFLWGSATSGPQSEGAFAKPNLSIMDYWYKKTPNDFHNQIGPDITSDLFHNYEKDIEIMNSLKLNSFRTSIQWTRLIENFQDCRVNKEAVEFYRNYFFKLKLKNIKLIVNLFHFDMPIELQNLGGFENKKVVSMYAEYARTCFELFGDLVDDWATFNEPIVPIEGGYLYEWYYPKIVDFKRGIQAAYGTILAHAKAVNIFHSMFANDPNKKITIILNLTPAYPKDQSKDNLQAARIRDLLFNKSFLETTINGVFPKELIELFKKEDLLPNYTKLELLEIKNSYIDYLGVNYYQPSRVQARTKPWSGKIMPEKWFENFVWNKRRINPHRGWEIHPETIYKIAMEIKNNYKNINWFVAENGMGVENEIKFKNSQGFIDDQYRIDFIKEHLYWLNKAILEGSNCFGYHVWTFIDCWSWANAYKNRYGLIELDLQTQKRTIKKSGYWFKEIIENKNIIEIDDELIKL
ncbi:6-phospho-beta-glucosidase [Williamsoniiplasma somnilux]|uniref:6-phospho-beta-glucosidase n=1 Tax=Williamsoniiplasma somnilux TaxID=215578 RepID=A0A2K8NYK9_9MOLU|nr:glycoside hydrolase family 1 protein [Williamsoniiplasma somnilux]ATZ18922.1 6-phospho-beta-glucosidase [Williamsoniiplasma somnilux]